MGVWMIADCIVVGRLSWVSRGGNYDRHSQQADVGLLCFSILLLPMSPAMQQFEGMDHPRVSVLTSFGEWEEN